MLRMGYFLPGILCIGGCLGGSTGGGLVSFSAFASGVTGVTSTTAFAVAGYKVTLSRARLHMGAVYLTASTANNSSQSCIEPGRYVGQVTGSVDVDVLSPAPQPFSVQGSGTQDQALTGEVWLTGGDVNAQEDATVIVDLAGVAQNGAVQYPFEAQVTIGSNRAQPVSNPAEPGLNPICKRRIVSPIPINLQLSAGETLRVQIDPRPWFNTVSFNQLDQITSSPPLYQIPDSDNSGTVGAAAGRNLFVGLRANSGVYTFSVQAE